MLGRVVYVVGATGVGKTKLGVELAKEFNGEVINADSMQVYDGLRIATNQPVAEERKEVPHHLFAHVPPSRFDYNVNEWLNDAISLIKDTWQRGNLPIVVGGTCYWIEALAFQTTLLSSGGQALDNVAQEGSESKIEEDDSDASVWSQLYAVDPEAANRLHPKDTRRIRRALQVVQQTGELASQVQRKEISPRFHNFFIWVQCDLAVLDQRLDERVDRMAERGLFEEISSFDVLSKKMESEQYTRGVLQSIGGKEFDEYLTVLDGIPAPAPATLELAKEKCLSRMKANTRRYVRKQNTFIRNRLARRTSLLSVDSSDVHRWNDAVLCPSVKEVRAFLNGEQPVMAENAPKVHETNAKEHERYVCECCRKVLLGETAFKTHMKSRGHRRTKKRSIAPCENKPNQ